LTGFRGKIVCDETQPNGQPRRCLDVSRAYAEFGWRASTPLDDGLRQTVAWHSTALGVLHQTELGEQ
jgi:GDP-L-fucose synthase